MKERTDSGVTDGRPSNAPDGSGEYEVPAIISDKLVLFPGIEVVTDVSESDMSAVREAQRQHKVLAYIPSVSRSATNTIGTLAMLRETGDVEKSAGLNLALKGMWRIRIKKFIQDSGCLKVHFERAEETTKARSTEISSLMKKVQGDIDEFVELIPEIPSEIVSVLKNAQDPGTLADICANSPDFSHANRIDLLKTLDQMERLRMVSRLLEDQLAKIRKVAEVEPISQCEKCIELADTAFESDPSKRSEIAVSFLNHVVNEHTGELLTLLAEKYGPIFLNRRSLR